MCREYVLLGTKHVIYGKTRPHILIGFLQKECQLDKNVHYDDKIIVSNFENEW